MEWVVLQIARRRRRMFHKTRAVEGSDRRVVGDAGGYHLPSSTEPRHEVRLDQALRERETEVETERVRERRQEDRKDIHAV